jgi:dTDP-4-dehydrorhamnose reductase
VKAAERCVLIIGRHGQIATSLSEAQLAPGNSVVTIGRPEIDLCDRDSISRAIRAFRPRIVINAAAYTAVDRAEDEPELARAVNATGAEAVAIAAAEVGATIIHFSTDYVFDGTKRAPYLETDSVAPLGSYGRSKLEGEALVAAANPRHIILRTAWVFSPYGSNFAKTMLRLNQERPEIGVVDDQYGTPTYAPDLAEAICQLIAKLRGPTLPSEFFGTFHAVNAGETTWCGFARAIVEGAAHRGAPCAVVQPICTSDYPTKARRPAYSLLSTEKLALVYGLQLRSWEDALPDALDRLIGPTRDEATQYSERNFGQST